MEGESITPEKAEEFAQAVGEVARIVVREEIASLCGLMLNRLGNSGQPGAALMRSAWGEALRDFAATSDEPGPLPPGMEILNELHRPRGDDPEVA